MKREWCLVHEFWASENRYHEDRCGRVVRSGECTFREPMTLRTMVTDAVAAEWRGILDANRGDYNSRQVERILRDMLADRERFLALLCLLDVQLSASSNMGLQKLLDETVRMVVRPEHYKLVPKAEAWLKEAHGE